MTLNVILNMDNEAPIHMTFERFELENSLLPQERDDMIGALDRAGEYYGGGYRLILDRTTLGERINTLVTFGDLREAADKSNVDYAIKLIMDRANIESGDVAGQVFAGRELGWRSSGPRWRFLKLMDWLDIECQAEGLRAKNFGVWCSVSGGVTGTRQAWLKEHGTEWTGTEAEAKEKAAEALAGVSRFSTCSINYQARER